MITLKKDNYNLYRNKENEGNFRQGKHIFGKDMEVGIKKEIDKEKGRED